MADDTISDEISESALGPKQVTIGGETAQAHPIPDLIEADRYLREREARQNGKLGISLRRLKAPSSL